MHQSFETTAPWSGGVPVIAGEMCHVFTFPMAPQCGVNAVVLFSCQNCGDMGIYRGRGGIWRGIYQPLVPAGQIYLGLARPKVKVPAIPRTRGGSGYN